MSAPHWLKTCWQGCRYCGRGFWRLVRWLCWLILIFTAGLQVVILTSRNLRVPDFMLREIESNLGAAGLQAEFGDVVFDPVGRILLQDVDLSLAVIGTPVMHADSIYLEVDPLALWWREIEPRQVSFSGVDLLIPAVLSPSGKPEALISGIDATLRPTETRGQLALDHFTARVGSIPLSAHGAIQLPTLRTGPSEPWDQLMSRFSTHYVSACRQAGRQLKHLSALEDLHLRVGLEPHPEFLARVKLTADASGVTLPAIGENPLRGRLEQARLTTSFRLTTEAQALPIDLRIGRLTVDEALQIEGVRVQTELELAAGDLSLTGSALQLSAHRVDHAITGVSAVTVRTDLRTLPLIQADVTARLAGEPVALKTDLDATSAAGKVSVAGRVGAPLLNVAAQQIGFDVPSILQWDEAPHLSANVNLGPRGKPLRAEARFSTGEVEARRVPLTATSALVQWHGSTLRADQIMLRTGPSVALGSYEMDTATRDFRFLLRGRLDPPGIQGWFRDWWVKLFDQFDFTGGLPDASVEVSGRWGAPLETKVFVRADATAPVVRGIPMNRMRTRLFTRPGWADVMHFLAERPMGDVEGSFLRQWRMPDSRRWTRVEIHAGGVTDLSPAPKLLRRAGEALIAPFEFEQPLQLRLDGIAEREDWGAPVSETFDISGSVEGPWKFKAFPFDGTSFAARRENDRILINKFAAEAAGGRVEGRIELQGEGDDQLVAFDLNLAEASLGETMHDVSAWLAVRRGEKPQDQTEFEKQMADGRLTLALTAEGPTNDLLGLQGSGSAAVTDANFSNINLLGVLSALLERTILNFSTLQLNHANADFTLNGPLVEFSQIKATGNRGAVDAAGTFSMADQALDFTTRVRPFEGGEGLLDAVFTPFSSVLEVKLGGKLGDPEWTFVYGPTNLLRNLTGENARNRPKPTPTVPPVNPPSDHADPSQPPPPPPESPDKAVPEGDTE